MRPRAVLFDFGGTLYSYRPFRVRFIALLRDIARTHDVAADEDRLGRAYVDAMAAVARAYQGRSGYRYRDFFGDAAEAYVRALGADPQSRVRDHFYAGQTELVRALIEPRGDTREVLGALRAAGLHIGIVSNIDDDQFEPLWEAIALAPLVDAVTTSEQAGSCKPHDRIYRVALEKAGLRPCDAIFVGDSFHQDVMGARALGMTAVLLAESAPDPEQAAQCDHVIGELRELLPILDL